MSQPVFSVVLPVYNAARFVADAIAGLAAQSLSELEFIVIDDGSTDASPGILAEWARRDPRVRLVRHAKNEGLLTTLNDGLAMASAPWIARQDADDLLDVDRLVRLRQVVSDDDQIAVVGSAFNIADSDGRVRGVAQMPCTDTGIRWRLLFDTPFYHSSVVFRRQTPDGAPVRYESLRCEDYDLWARLLRHGKGKNLPEALVTRREHENTYTVREAGPQAGERTRIAHRELRRVWPRTRLAEADVVRIHRWDTALPTLLGPAEIQLCSEIADVLVAFARNPEIDAREARSILRRWTARMLYSLPDYRYRQAWRAGLCRRLLRACPALVLGDLMQRFRRHGIVHAHE